MTESKDLLKLESLKPHEVFGEGGAEAERQIQAAFAAEEKRKSENKEHRRAVNQKVLAALIENDLTEEQAKKIIALILGNFVPHVTINY